MRNRIVCLISFIASLILASPAAAETYTCNAAYAGKKTVFVLRGERCVIPTPPSSPKGAVVQVTQGATEHSLHLTQVTNQSSRATLYLDAKHPVLRGVLIRCRNGNDRIIWTEAPALEYGANMNAGLSALCQDQREAREEYLRQRRF